jgi:hypothetical protein
MLATVLAAAQAVRQDHHPLGDRMVTARYLALIAILSWMCTLAAPLQAL